MPIISKTIPNLVGIQMYYIPPEVVDPLATPIYQNWDSNIIIDQVGNRTQYDASTNPDNVLLYSWNMEYLEGLNPPEPPKPPELSYFYIKNEWSNNINIQHTNENGTVYYRILPDTEWSSWNINTNILLLSGQKCEIKRDSINRFGLFKCNFSLSVGGNIMSLIYGDNYEDKTTITTLRMFLGLFEYANAIVDASNLVLPATTLSNYCYSGMFNGCILLTTAPELPATTLSYSCYYLMFRNCTSLTTAPELPATTLASGCYSSMFLNCSSLTTAPELPATTLADYCYSQMFIGCSALTEAPELPATTLVNSCYSHMFLNCTSLTTAPELPATTLVNYCYHYMFYNCSNLNYIKAMFINAPGESRTYDWVYGVAENGTFVMNSAATWNPESYRGSYYGIPGYWTVQTASS